MFVVYENAQEVIVTTEEKEEQAILDYFTNGGRDEEDYNRKEVDEVAVQIAASADLWTD